MNFFEYLALCVLAVFVVTAFAVARVVDKSLKDNE
jgi:hypothetical protein